ncbi:MAG: alpha/beta fold hydrolase [Burkholderiales bacterium]|nr:alpha/beta fold hydrolase [Burkholderiales bacterium]
MSQGHPHTLTTRDGARIAAHTFAPAAAPRASVVIGPAMGVAAFYYHPLAAHLATAGFAVTTFDYRGVGGSLEGPLRRHPATLTDWVRQDYPAAIAHARRHAPAAPVYLLGHSLGAQVPGLFPEVDGIAGLLGLATGSGYWRTIRPSVRRRFPLLAYAVGPVSMALAGYFPGRKIGIFDDVPAGAMRQWLRWCRHPRYCAGVEPGADAAFARARFPVHYVSFTDDEFMTVEGTEAMLDCYTAAPRRHTRIAPADWGAKRIGHLGVFRKDMAPHWPRIARLIDDLPALGAAPTPTENSP